MAITIDELPIGYSYLKISHTKDGYAVYYRTKMQLKIMGQGQEIVSDFSSHTDYNFNLRDFVSSFISQDQKIVARGQRQGSKIIIEIQNGTPKVKEISLAYEKIYTLPTLPRILAQRNFKISPDFTLKVFEPSFLEVVDVKVNVLGTEKVPIKNQKLTLTKVSYEMFGLKSYLWINNEGESKKELSAPNIVAFEVNPDEALRNIPFEEQLDLLTRYAILSDTIINHPRDIKYLKVLIYNLDTTELKIQDDFQNILSTNPLKLEIAISPQISDSTHPVLETSQYLKPSLHIQSDNPAIIDAVRKIIGNETSAPKKARKILYWVYKNLKKETSATIPSAIQVLKNLKGDCNEHAILYCALARAAGIPTEICVGLVYLDGKFYYHAWNKIYLNNKWIPVDPTFGQFPTDASHIKLTEGELVTQIKILKIVGAIRIKVLEYH
jgi:hypothetical protein